MAAPAGRTGLACASTSAPRPASARPSPCSTRGGAAAERGADVVVGFVETHGRAEDGRADRRPRGRAPAPDRSTAGTEFEEMDLDAVLARRPEVALVDELAHTNVPGSRNEKRWQDVEELLDAGIDVISTVNIQHLESLNDVVERITGVAPAGDHPRRRRARRRPGRAGRHDPRGAAPAHGPRQHLRRRQDRRRPRQLLPGRATWRRCGSWRCSGSPTGSTTPSRTTASATASPSRGRRASGSSSPSPAPRGPSTSSAGRPASPSGPTASSSGSTSPPTAGCRRAVRRAWSRPSGSLLEELGGELPRGRRPPTSPRRWSTSPGPRTPPRSCSAPAAARGWQRLTQRLGHQPGHPPVRAHRRPRDLRPTSTERATATRPLPLVQAGADPAVAAPPGRGAGVWRPSACRSDRWPWPTPATTFSLPTVLLLYLGLAMVVALVGGVLPGGWSRWSAGSCCANYYFTAAALRPDASPRARTSSPSSSTSLAAGMVAVLVDRLGRTPSARPPAATAEAEALAAPRRLAGRSRSRSPTCSTTCASTFGLRTPPLLPAQRRRRAGRSSRHPSGGPPPDGPDDADVTRDIGPGPGPRAVRRPLPAADERVLTRLRRPARRRGRGRSASRTRPVRPRSWPRPTSCGPRCCRRSRTTSAPRWPRSRRRSAACASATSTWPPSRTARVPSAPSRRRPTG